MIFFFQNESFKGVFHPSKNKIWTLPGDRQGATGPGLWCACDIITHHSHLSHVPPSYLLTTLQVLPIVSNWGLSISSCLWLDCASPRFPWLPLSCHLRLCLDVTSLERAFNGHCAHTSPQPHPRLASSPVIVYLIDGFDFLHSNEPLLIYLTALSLSPS